MRRPRYERFAFLLHTLVSLSTDTIVSAENQCLNPDGDSVGPKGSVSIQAKNDFVGESFERLYGENCPCSFAKTKCVVDDPKYGNGDCSSLVIDGKDAAINGYPSVKVKHILKICNFNEVNSIMLAKNSPYTKMEFFYSATDTSGTSNFIVDKSYRNHLLGPGRCKKEIAKTSINTSRAKYNMKAVLGGSIRTPSGDTVNDGLCYASSENKVDFKYDYGLGECKMSTETLCYLADGSRKSCEDQINSLDINSPDSVCKPFKAVFVAKACNNNDRDVEIQVGASNYKINKYEKKRNGTHEREKAPLPKEISARTCEEFNTTKFVNPCEKNFWQVHIQGKLYITEEKKGWHFKDKDCQSYSYSMLTVLDPNDKITVPQNQPPSSYPSFKPSIYPTVSIMPTTPPTTPPPTSSTASPKPSNEPSMEQRTYR